MIFILKLDLDMVQMYLYTENEIPSYNGSKVVAWTDGHTETQTDTQTDLIEIITYPQIRMVIILILREFCIKRDFSDRISCVKLLNWIYNIVNIKERI